VTKGEIQQNIYKKGSPRVSTNRVGLVGPSPDRVGPEEWPTSPTLARWLQSPRGGKEESIADEVVS
jgi:hypothetical protein